MKGASARWHLRATQRELGTRSVETERCRLKRSSCGCQGRPPCSISTVAGVQPGFPSADRGRLDRDVSSPWTGRGTGESTAVTSVRLTITKGCPGALHRLASRGGPACVLGSQLIALVTSSLILFSSVRVHDVSANSTGHMAPSSRFALSLKPSVAYLVLNFSAGLK